MRLCRDIATVAFFPLAVVFFLYSLMVPQLKADVRDRGDFDRITCKEITVHASGGNGKCVIGSYGSGVGMWMTNGSGKPMVAIYNTSDQGAVVSIAGPRFQGGDKPLGGFDLAFNIRKDYEPELQVMTGKGKYHFISMSDLAKWVQQNKERKTEPSG